MTAIPRENLDDRLAELERRWQRTAEAVTAAQAEVDALREDREDDLEALRNATARLLKAQHGKRSLADEMAALEDQL